MQLKHFTLSEFDSPDLPGSGDKMNREFLLMLDKARDIAGIPFRISSGYRTIFHNEAVGGLRGSSHCEGRAADILYEGKAQAVRIIASLTVAGFRRIGMSSNFIHCDNSPDKPSPAYWGYWY